MDDKLLKVVLAMDSYNRGYNYGIRMGNLPDNSDSAINGVTKLGDVTVFRSLGDAAAQSIGFYATAYEYNGEVIVSYRGTDLFLNDEEHGIGGDVIDGYFTGAGIGAWLCADCKAAGRDWPH